MAKHKKNVYCRAELHDFEDNVCIKCGEIDDYLFAPDYWFAGMLLGREGKKRHKREPVGRRPKAPA